ncbi:fungal-specific transcription factor domain-containing protein [Blakeslea trispora]|nr:fungal-specific transcription factor domain-containing protein [Blakeslea trispora]
MDNLNNTSPPLLIADESYDKGSERHNSNDSKRTRITRACDTCRRKKIKCDVNTRQPCSTCTQYNWECTFNQATKKRGPPKGYIESLETRLEKMESLLKGINNQASVHPELAEETKRQRIEPTVDSMDQDQQPKVLRDVEGKVYRYHGSSSGYYLVGDILSNNRDEEGAAVVSESTEQPQQRGSNPKKMYIVPSFNKPNSNYRLRRVNMDDDDLMIIRDTTADEEAVQLEDDKQETIECIMPKSVLNALVQAYFEDAHVTLPVIERDEYMDAFEGRTTPPPAPLLTYAICTYACFFVKEDSHVFTDAKVKRDEIFQLLLERTNTLVRKEYLKPRVATIQALTLLCAHPTYSTSSYRNWIFAGMAIRMAQDLGLHRTVTTIQVSEELKEKRKRLFYSTYVTDRWCSAIMGRPLAIADSDCDIDLPSIRGPNGNEDLTLFVHFVKLSGILGEVLRRIYSPRAKANGYRTKTMSQTVWSLQRMLTEWLANVPESRKITEQDLENIHHFPPDSKKIVEGGPLTICYYAVILLLHRPFIVLDVEGDHDTIVQKATETCTHAAKVSTNIARAIPYTSIAKFGWNFAAYSVLQAALIHIYNCTSSDPRVAEEARNYATICKEECLVPLGKDAPTGPPLIAFLQTLSSLLESNKKRDKQNQVFTGPSSSQPLFQQNPSTSPMNIQQMAGPPVFANDNSRLSLAENGQSWLLNGGMPALPQMTWQQLFSTAGGSFPETPNPNFDIQGK